MLDPRAPIIAARAAQLAVAAGVELADDLALWQLAGSRPRVEAISGRPEELGLLLEGSHDARGRRLRGAHYTPEPLAAGLASRALAGHVLPSVCDPACGGGALLLAVARDLAAQCDDPADIVTRLWGADIDPLAIATTEVALTLWAGVAPPAGHLQVADTLLDPPDWGPFDVVVGNPPFLSQLDQVTTRGAADVARLRVRFGAAVRAYTDTAALFLLAGCAMVRRGGTVVMLQPQSVMAARDAAGVRDAVDARASMREVWAPAGRSFRAAVDVCVVSLDVGTVGDPPRSWGTHLSQAQGVPVVRLGDGPTVGDEATTGAAFRTEYYGIAPHVHEQDRCPDGQLLLTTGLVDLGRDAWGERPARVAGRRWERPVVDAGPLEGRAADWVRRAEAPKLIVASQTRVVEVVVDPDGRFIPSVPLVVAWAPRDRLWALAAALSSPAVTAWAAERAAGTALSAGALKLTAALVRAAPLPTDLAAWASGTDAFQRGDLERFAEAMTSAYECSPDVTAWWLERVGICLE